MRRQARSFLTVTAAVAALAGCPANPPETSCLVEVPAAWSAPEWDVNTIEALALRGRLDALTGGPNMRGAEDGTVTTITSVSDLDAVFTAGTPSLASLTQPTFAPLVNESFAEFIEVIEAGPQSLVSATGEWAPGAEGGIYGTSFRGINEGGIEVRQIVDKGLFGGGAFYAYALGLTEDVITPATVDSLAAVMGHNKEGIGGDEELADSARYAFFQGYHAETMAALTAARAYAADIQCDAERDAALVNVFRLWEKGVFARFAHYVNGAATDVAAAADDDAYAGALHDLAEGIGLAMGFRGLEEPATGPLAGQARLVTDAAIDDMLQSLGVNTVDLGASTTGELLIETNFAGPITTVEGKLTETLDVDAAEVAGWRNPSEG